MAKRGKRRKRAQGGSAKELLAASAGGSPADLLGEASRLFAAAQLPELFFKNLALIAQGYAGFKIFRREKRLLFFLQLCQFPFQALYFRCRRSGANAYLRGRFVNDVYRLIG